ncbi:MAG: mechanosensitive ion channel domain-containing protein [Halieaceae bacterium]
MTRTIKLIAAVVFLSVLPVMAQDGSDVSLELPLIESAITQAEANTELSEEDRNKLLDSYRRAQGTIQSVASFKQKQEAYAAAQKTAAAEAAKIQKRLDKDQAAAEGKSAEPAANTRLEQVEQLVQRDKADLAAQEAKASDLDSRLKAEDGRPTALRERLSELKQQQDEITAAAKLPAAEGETALFAKARTWNSTAKSAAVRAEISMLEAELLSQPMRLDLMKAQRYRANFDVVQLRARIKAFDLYAIKLRQGEAEQAQAEAESAQEQAAGKHPLILELAQANADLSGTITDRTAALERIKSEEASAEEDALRFEKDLQSVQRKLEVLGMSQALGRVLREQQQRMPQRHKPSSTLSQRDKLVSDASLLQFDYEDERRELRSISRFLDAKLAEVPQPVADDIRDDLEELAGARRDLVKQAADIEATYLKALGTLDFSERRAASAAASYREFVSERLLWIRSNAPISFETFKPMPQELMQLLAPAAWWHSVQLFIGTLVKSPFYALLFLLVAVLFRFRPRLISLLRSAGDAVGDVERDRLRYSFRALGLGSLFALAWPLLLFSLGLTLQAAENPTNFSKALAASLQLISYYFLVLEFVRLQLVHGGLVLRHFNWSPPITDAVRRELTALELAFVPAAFTAMLANRVIDSGGRDSVSMIALAVTLLAIARFFARMPNFISARLERSLRFRRTPRRSLLAQLTRQALVGIPLVLVVAMLLGYVHTATRFLVLLLLTNLLLVGVLLIHEFGMRWLRLLRLRLIESERAIARQIALERAADPEADTDIAAEEPHEPDPEALDEAGRKLLHGLLLLTAILGTWAVWAPVLPALGIINSIELWSTTELVAGAEVAVPVTLSDLGVAFLIGFAGFVAVKRVPSLLEIFLRQKVELTSGSVYAAVTLLRYALIILFVVIVIGQLGGSWSQIQWAVAALSVGIGFGLQEIVANFISGLILLFEQPIRVGDVVTVGETSGTVTRIQMRATTIRDWDGRELLVPNKEFITGRLLNWSLSDKQSRINIKIGVAYGTDLPLAMKLALEVADEHEQVIADPAPFITFDDFGDNSLLLVLRCYLANVDNRLTVSSQIRQAVNDKYNAAGIVIAFPQRDVHLDTSSPLAVHVKQLDGLPAE